MDVRIISATHKNLGEMVQDKTFREDLYHRISVVPIHIPSLRERPGDIMPLIHHFLDIVNNQYGLQKTLSEIDTHIFRNQKMTLTL